MGEAEDVQARYEREERAALQGAPDAMPVEEWERLITHPVVAELQRLGLCHSVEVVRAAVERGEAA
jgi:hypothetical protein